MLRLLVHHKSLDCLSKCGQTTPSLNAAFRSDVTWWQIFAANWRADGNKAQLTTYASGMWGCGGWSEAEWFQLAQNIFDSNIFHVFN